MSKFIVNNLKCEKNYNIIFDNISFSLSNGDILKVSGANGSGKTSLLKILAGISSCEYGDVNYNNQKIYSSAYQKNICYIGHLGTINYDLKCKENLSYLANIQGLKKANIKKALTAVGLKSYENEYTNNLSAGQKRLVTMAIIFINKAPILLLDEPFTALDDNSTFIIEKAIKKHVANGGICILTTHQKCNLTNIKSIAL